MKTFYTLFTVLSLFSISTAAQQVSTGSADSIGSRELRVLTAKLQLTPFQQKSVRDTFIKFYTELSVLNADSAARSNSVQQVQKGYENALKNVFSPAQWRKYELFIEERKQKLDVHSRGHSFKPAEIKRTNVL